MGKPPSRQQRHPPPLQLQLPSSWVANPGGVQSFLLQAHRCPSVCGLAGAALPLRVTLAHPQPARVRRGAAPPLHSQVQAPSQAHWEGAPRHARGRAGRRGGGSPWSLTCTCSDRFSNCASSCGEAAAPSAAARPPARPPGAQGAPSARTGAQRSAGLPTPPPFCPSALRLPGSCARCPHSPLLGTAGSSRRRRLLPWQQCRRGTGPARPGRRVRFSADYISQHAALRGERALAGAGGILARPGIAPGLMGQGSAPGSLRGWRRELDRQIGVGGDDLLRGHRAQRGGGGGGEGQPAAAQDRRPVSSPASAFRLKRYRHVCGADSRV